MCLTCSRRRRERFLLRWLLPKGLQKILVRVGTSQLLQDSGRRVNIAGERAGRRRPIGHHVAPDSEIWQVTLPEVIQEVIPLVIPSLRWGRCGLARPGYLCL